MAQFKLNMACTEILLGAQALDITRSQSQLEAAGIRTRLKAIHEIFIAAFQQPAASAEHDRLLEILCAQPTLQLSNHVFVVPRYGTVSPWSSKAEDIAARCHIDSLARIERGMVYAFDQPPDLDALMASGAIHDRMTETLVADAEKLPDLFTQLPATGLRHVALAEKGIEALYSANTDWGLALSDDEVAFLAKRYQALGRNPTDVELMMFGQINSEHCRHKIFNAVFELDGQPMPDSLFGMIQKSHKASPDGVLSAYSDNSAVLAGPRAARLMANADGRYRLVNEAVHLAIKVETHNHPTAIAPGPGAATGAGGEIRDEAATGRGGFSKAGLTGFAVSDLRLPGDIQPWENDPRRPGHLQSALDIMTAGPIGAARYNNEFGRPNLCGFFRTLVHSEPATGLRAFHKPIMIAGGMGNVRPAHVAKQTVSIKARLVVLGGPAMRIGLGGGATSSLTSDAMRAELDFASVQRANPEIQRRAQQVIDACVSQADRNLRNPIVSIHDVGAGGLSNALPELVHADDRGGRFQLRDIQSADSSLSPAEIWCNEAQERFVLAINDDQLPRFESIARRERCPFCIVGEAVAEQHLTVVDATSHKGHSRSTPHHPVDLPMDMLFDHVPEMTRTAVHNNRRPAPFETNNINLDDAIKRVLRMPSVGSKAFLITIGDRSIGGRTARDQMVGPWQVPVADVAVTTTTHDSDTGEAMATGERPPVALIHSAASARLAVGEAITNIAAACINSLTDVRLSANWMAAAGDPAEDAALFDAVQAVGQELAPALGISIPVGKDSLSMRSAWQNNNETLSSSSPVSLVITAFAPVRDAARTLTPQLVTWEDVDTDLIVFDLSNGANRLGGSALAQAFNHIGDNAPDLEDPKRLIAFFNLVQSLAAENQLLAYHDRSDGGLLACVTEMMFAGRVGVDMELEDPNLLAALFSEELGAVLQVDRSATLEILNRAQNTGISARRVGRVTHHGELRIYQGRSLRYAASLTDLAKRWSATSHAIQRLRDNPTCADAEFAAIDNASGPGLLYSLTFTPDPAIDWPRPAAKRPSVAILREQGVNGHTEMAAAFTRAGFDAFDVHMSDLEAGGVLDGYQGLAVCGGFSYGDVMGAGRGWAYSILYDDRLRGVFADFFSRPETFTLGVCNGCQMLSELAEIIPGSEGWPRFVQNTSQQFEGRTSAVEIPESNSVLLAGMAGTQAPIAVAHGEGRALFNGTANADSLAEEGRIGLRYIDNSGVATTAYPANPNGSPAGITGVTSKDGRVLLSMPHPERVTRSLNLSWGPACTSDQPSPWARVFSNARRFVD